MWMDLNSWGLARYNVIIMALLYLPRLNQLIDTPAAVRDFLWERSLPIERREPDVTLTSGMSDADILNAYATELKPFMAQGGYLSADVIQVNGDTPNLNALHDKFFQEHTHSEDEVRFFIRGSGDFWIHLDDAPDGVFCIRAQAGDLLSVPAGTTHWFDFGLSPDVTVIRIFTSADGWVADYTGNEIAKRHKWPQPSLI